MCRSAVRLSGWPIDVASGFQDAATAQSSDRNMWKRPNAQSWDEKDGSLVHPDKQFYVFLFSCLFVCLFVCMFVCLFVCLYVCLFVCLFVCFVCLFV